MEIATIINLLGVAALIALTAFFVASEFAIVKVRSTQLEPHIEGGSKRALAAKRVVSNLDEYLSACQLGITITALGIGRLAEPTFERMLHPIIGELAISEGLVTTISIVISFGIATFLHVVIGELAPKTLAIQKAEQVTLWISRPLIWFYRLLYPFIWVLNGSARLLTKAVGLHSMSEHEVTHSEEELRLILSDSYKSGEINLSEFNYVSKIFDFDERVAKEIMVPRPEMVTISVDDPIEDIIKVIRSEKYTRYPVVNGDKDHILGIINVRELLSNIVVDQTKELSIEEFIRPVFSVIESVPIKDVLVVMQKNQNHMAILFDEYGGTAGLLTMEDIIEEIVGEINDEFDEEEEPDVIQLDDDYYRISGQTMITEVNELLQMNIEEEDADTIGGWMLTQKYDVKEEEELFFDQYSFKINEFEGHQVKTIDVYLTPVDEDKIDEE
ncbi:hemolysin family protein [Alkalicoccobacillus murimartini]|uniref:CBS domain containing-hemolysin-like protein n=1 Tax=Alkalicoccobacillus murimartini TaxID=171685 RepID=A0ABT9YLL7_9BACI|nr:hemolysin family protein [Alkalicoccobacillus murimartini]MDQ0208774.1 CBS domain containing-hemolysin-like protein [Alkalicoccobacillus murimartini]